MKKLNKILSVVLSLTLCAGLVAPALAVTYDIGNGDVHVEKDKDGVYSYQGKKAEAEISRDTDITVTGTSVHKAAEKDEDGNVVEPEVTGHTISVANGVTDTTITLKGVYIDVSATGINIAGKCAFNIQGESTDVTVELDGENTLRSAQSSSGLGVNQGASVTIRDGDEDGIGSLTAEGGLYGAGIGGGKTGDITIEGGNVTAKGGTYGTGIGGSNGGKVGNITITGDGTTVTARGSGSAAIGGGRNGGTVESITITGGSTVTATNPSQGAGIGGGFAGSAGDITISGEGTTVTATGGENAAGIGGGSFGSVGNIIIEGGSTVTATATGSGGAGIGSGRKGTAGDITIKGNGTTVTATGGAGAAGIGAGNGGGAFGAVRITGGDIVARSGYQASAIGNGDSGTGGTIAIQGVNSLIALGDYYFAVDTRSDTDGVEQTILNGRFLEEIGATDSNGLTKVEEIEFVIVNAQGETVKTFTLKPRVSTNMYDSFAVNLAEGGTYYVFPKSAESYGGSLTGYGTDGKQVACVIEENDMLNADLMQFPSFEVSYRFVSGTEGQELPESVTAIAPASESGKKVTMDQMNELISATQTYADVAARNGTWHFESWTGSKEAVDENGMLTDVELVGTWTFTPAPVTDPTVEIDGVDVPLAGLFTRADAIGYLWQQAGSPEWELSTFEDVPEDHQWAVAIGWAQDMGIALPDLDGNFRPDDLVERSVADIALKPEGELEQFLNRYAVYAGIELDEDELFIELAGAPDDVIMGEEAQVIFDDFFAKLETALAQAA
ncbi:MAG: SHIRT domain-containing protein [Oscillospiraceae bacterium]|nr:SHIRT domain-containing protein [Oscillospiraceae bacterium]MDE7170509.1 SHIRT domain-containing protein [Oscillospiraceae bacterium]